MNQTQVMLAVIEMARVNGAMPIDEAISAIAARIDKLDMASSDYERDVHELLSIGATLWVLASGRA